MKAVKKTGITILFFTIIVFLLWKVGQAHAQSFIDVPKTDPCAQAITYLEEKKVIIGNKGEFAPNDNLTNGQACLMVCRAFYPDTLVKTQQEAASFLASKKIFYNIASMPLSEAASFQAAIGTLLWAKNYQVVYDPNCYLSLRENPVF